MSRNKARRALWNVLHHWRSPPRPPVEYRHREYFGPYSDDEPEVREPGVPYKLAPLRVEGQLDDTLLAFGEAKWAGRCRNVGPAGYLCTESTHDGPHDVHRSMAPSGEVFDVWTWGPEGEELLDECDTEALHLAAGLCIAHYQRPGEHQYTCTRDEAHDGDHVSEGPEGEVFAKWPA
jgi:hypothetical protein